MEHKYNASFDLYGPAGVRVRFSVAANEQAEHLAQVDSYLGSLLGGSYSVEPAGMEAGEEVETIGGWVLGETSKDEHCLFLYAANAGLQFRVATVFVEKMGEMPFEVGKAKVWPGQAPTRDVAEKKGFFHSCPDFKIVMKPTGKLTDKGEVITKYDRVYGVSAPPAATTDATAATPPAQAKPGKQAGPPMPPEVKFQTAPPADEDDEPVKVGRWTSITSKGVMNSGKSYNFAGADDALDFGLALGAFDDRETCEVGYELAKAAAKPADAKAMWSAWLDYLAGIVNDSKLWNKGDEKW